MTARQAVAIYPSADRVEIVVPRKRRLFSKDEPQKTLTFAWSNVTRVVAFKRDQLAVDCICLAFWFNDNRMLEVNEHMDGWKALVDAVPVYLQGALSEEEWWEKVVFPTFEPCWTEIYACP